MSRIALFIAETYQGNFIPVAATPIYVDEFCDYWLEPLSASMPFVLLEHAQDFLNNHPIHNSVVYEQPIKMNMVGIKWLSELETAQRPTSG